MEGNRLHPLLFAVLVCILGIASAKVFNCVEEQTCTNSATLSHCYDPSEPCEGKIIKNGSIPCGCCDLCIEYLEEGERCETEPSNFPKEMCGPRLECRGYSSSNDDPTCGKMNTPCVQRQVVYEEGSQNTTFRPECDDYGSYAAKQCLLGSLCYCVDKDGIRIPGEAAEAEQMNKMNCECSRAVDYIKKTYPGAKNLPRCLANGNYDTLQCYDDVCYCIREDLTPSDTIFASPDFIDQLPCYNKSVHPPSAKHECIREVEEAMLLLEEMQDEADVIVGYVFPSCGPDGKYNPVQRRGSWGICVTPEGHQIGSYEALEGSLGFEQMNCYCARAEYWANTVGGWLRPRCCPNGNFYPWQCTGPTCTCMNAQGETWGTVEEVDLIMNLACYTETPCPDIV
ncbi:unnamed protein product [Darwinula stevensoni]|uniref:Thyroglobulin type-1 domain-containing protein n=1 Tax=Darwinula stevensoni TaxID=69355 RepID=A0A7R8XFF1_9CRUS|nr:unnamed protein product [Darwinula stevensoni]CAG0895243.1 unnamed protein product [Darwinula stevensoni]